MKREVRVLVGKATDSLFLSIDHFNRPYERGRHEAVLIFLDRAFELLLKANIVHRGGKIREPRAAETIGFDRCVRKCVSEKSIQCITEEEAFTIQTVNSLRDAAQHYMISLSEQHLYLHAQAGVTLFGQILKKVFDQTLADHFPERVLPITTSPPQNLAAVVTAEFSDVKRLLAPRSRKRLEAFAKLRSLAVIEKSLAGERVQPTPRELNSYADQIRKNLDWTKLFPGVASLQLETTGSGLTVSLRITKTKGEPIRLVEEGTPDATIVGVKRVNELDYYSLGLKNVARKIQISEPKVLAVVRKLAIQENPEFFKVIKIGRTEHKRYSQKALDRIITELQEHDINIIWQEYHPAAWRAKQRKRKNAKDGR